MEPLAEKLRAVIRGDVDDSTETLTTHSRDASLFDIRPSVVVYPKDTQDVSELVRFVAEEKKTNPKIALTPRAAGTCMSGGSLTDAISMDMMRSFGEIGAVHHSAPYPRLPHFPGARPIMITGEVVVGPGVYYRDFEEKTLAQNLLLPCFTASKSINALGGMIGNNSGGELSLKYGKTEDYIKDIEFVFADGSVETLREIPRREAEARATKPDFIGSVYRDVLSLCDTNRALIEAKRPQVSKNAAGYNLWNVLRHDKNTGEDTVDLSQLVVGSQGTLGVVTKATMRLVENIEDEKHSALLVVFATDLARLGEIVDETLTVDPEAVEAYDDKTIMLAVRFWRGFIRKQGFWGAIKLGLQFLPEFGMMLGGMPKIVLLVECAGPDKDQVLARLELLKKRLSRFTETKTRLVASHAAGEKYWTIRRDSFALLREHFQGKRTAPFIDDVIVPPAKLPEFLPAIREILERHKLTYNIHGHAGNGNFHIIPLIESDARLSEPMIMAVSEEVYALVIKLGGSITAEHNDGIIRTPFLADMFGTEMTNLFAQVKKIFDPQNIFNPGKKVGLTKGDIAKYLIKG